MKRAPSCSCRGQIGRDPERGYECVLSRAVIALRGSAEINLRRAADECSSGV
jgi:hypothetical protein